MSMQPALRQMPGTPGRAGVAHGEAGCEAASDEEGFPRHTTENTGSALLQAALTTENLQRAFCGPTSGPRVWTYWITGIRISQAAVGFR